MADLYSNDFWLKNQESVKRHLANQRGLSLEEAKAQAKRLKEWTKKEMERINKNKQ